MRFPWPIVSLLSLSGCASSSHEEAPPREAAFYARVGPDGAIDAIVAAPAPEETSGAPGEGRIAEARSPAGPAPAWIGRTYDEASCQAVVGLMAACRSRVRAGDLGAFDHAVGALVAGFDGHEGGAPREGWCARIHASLKSGRCSPAAL